MGTVRTFGNMINQKGVNSMPFSSQKQRAYLFATHPDMAKRWGKEAGPQPNLPKYANTKPKMPQKSPWEKMK